MKCGVTRANKGSTTKYFFLGILPRNGGRGGFPGCRIPLRACKPNFKVVRSLRKYLFSDKCYIAAKHHKFYSQFGGHLIILIPITMKLLEPVKSI